MARSLALLLFIGCFCPAFALAQPKNFNYDEDKVPLFDLPDPLVLQDGQKVTDAKTWQTRRRPEIVKLFETHVYGKSPAAPANMTFEIFEEANGALGGLAHRKQVTVYFNGKQDGPSMDILIYRPANAKGPVPAFVGLNFGGNHTITDEKAVRLSTRWMRPKPGIVNNRATEASRGTSKSRWAARKIVQHGYALATIYYGDIDPDFDDGFKNGIHAIYPKPKADEWGSIAAWAWGLSRALDYFEKDDTIDHKRVSVIGHSRLGKTSLWAGASDQRFALVISNDSGCGGAALSRRRFGETVARINTSFPHWFCDNFLKYNDNENALPVDQHMLIALMAPRPVYVASAEQDKWADPRGEFLSAKYAGPVYRLFGQSVIAENAQPAVNVPIKQRIGYHVRSGKHDVTDFDWDQYLDFADMHLRRR
jgi:hypothetical protein